jgi:hypothetical protein
MKRRMQNREAQRRFRERKEEHLTTLEKRAAITEERYKKLLKDTEQQTTETANLRTDNKRLKAETAVARAMAHNACPRAACATTDRPVCAIGRQHPR